MGPASLTSAASGADAAQTCVAWSSVKRNETVPTITGGRVGAAVNSTGTAGSEVSTAPATGSTGALVDTSVGRNITGSSFLYVRDFEFAGLAASERVPVDAAFGTALVSS